MEQVKTRICAWCRREYGDDRRPGRRLSDAEYRAYGRDPGASHGCCRPCGEAVRAEGRRARTRRAAPPPPRQIALGWQ